MSKLHQSGLAAVQNLYTAQVQLQEYMEAGLRTPKQVEDAKQCLKEFRSLLKNVDPQYMGGEDVLDGLHKMHEKMSERVKKTAAPKKAVVKKKSITKKAISKKPKTKKTTMRK
jgi:hypothetical protein